MGSEHARSQIADAKVFADRKISLIFYAIYRFKSCIKWAIQA
jgi:hypothetical protein